MNFDFTDAVRQALARGRAEAVRLRHDRVDTEHLLLGLVDDEEIGTLLGELGLTAEEIRAAVHEKVPLGVATRTEGDLPYDARGKKVLELAMSGARSRREKTIRPRDLLTAVLREGRGGGGVVLRELGLAAGEDGVIRRTRPARRPSAFRLRIDDASDLSIYEQIVARITEAVATAELRPGDRLPPVRQLADQLDIAPGTVARAYAGLEARGVVVTDGARGTHVAELPGPPSEGDARAGTLAGLLRPVAVAAFHLGATAAELRGAMERAMTGIFDKKDAA